MPDTTVSVKQDGTGDYTTISSAESAANISTGYYKIEIQDSNSYDETVNIASVTGTPSISNYVWLTVAEGHRHQGIGASSGHARLHRTNKPLTVSEEYTRVEYLDIDQTSSGGITVETTSGADNYLFSRCIIRDSHASGGSVGFQNLYSNDGSIDNCLFYNCTYMIYHRTDVGTFNINLDYCTVVGNLVAFWTIKGTYATAGTSHFYNTVLAPPYSIDSSGWGSAWTHNGSHNAWDTDTTYMTGNLGSYTDSQDISPGGVTTTTTTADAYIVTSLTSGSENYTPVPATGAGSNLVLGNGTNRQGSEPDSRQDFSTDIRGAARPTSAGKIDIGAFQITTAAGFKYWDGAAWADSTAVQYWNGSAWTDVTGIQYWNGSAWTDPS